MPKLFQAGRFGSGDIRARRFVIEGSHLVAERSRCSARRC